MYVWIAILLLVCTLVFYPIESFIPTNVRRVIPLEENVPVVRIEIECREPTSKPFLHLAEIELIDEFDKPVNYWTSPNSVHFEKGDDGSSTHPIKDLHDGNIDTYAHSKIAPDKLTILLKSTVGKNLPIVSSIQITNPKEGATEVIQKYDMKLYSQDKLIGTRSLTEISEKGASILYVLTRPSTSPVRVKDIPVDRNDSDLIDDIWSNPQRDHDSVDNSGADISGSIVPYNTNLVDTSYYTDFVGTIPGGPDGTYRLKKTRR